MQKINNREENKSSISDLTVFRSSELDLCVKCGSCKALCPTHIEFAKEGLSARGRIVLLKKLFSGEVEPSEALDERIFSCLLCGACNNLCPRGISITDAVYEGRRRLAAHSKKLRLFGMAMKYAFRDPSRAVGVLQLIESLGILSPLSRMQPFRALQELGLRIPVTRLRDGASLFKVPNPKGRIALFAGCTVDFIYPSMGLSLIYALNALDFDVVIQKGEVCCGAPLLGTGLKEEAADLAGKNISAFKRLQVEAVISLCPTCTHFIKDEYRKLIGDSIDKAMDISTFLADVIPSAMQPANDRCRAVYHDPCHSINYLGVKDTPRKILQGLGFELMEVERGCCGLGGTVRLMHEDVSSALLEKRIEAFGDAEMIITSCPNCVLQLGSRIKDRPVKHIIEIIAGNLKRR